MKTITCQEGGTLPLNEGNFKHNMDVLGKGSGQLLLRRRPKKGGIPISKFAPCPGCLGFMLKSELERHGRTCELVSLPNSVTARAEVLLGRFCDTRRSKVLSTIRDEEVRKEVLGDPTMLEYVAYTEESKGLSKNQQKVVTTRLSKLTQLLLQMRQKTQMKDMKICLPT